MTEQHVAELSELVSWAEGLMASRPPDFVVGEDYLRRWWVVPRNHYSNVYLHLMQADDSDRALHDHPFDNTSLILKGGYFEHLPNEVVERSPGQVISRPAAAAHRIALKRDSAGRVIPSMSLFFTGPVVRDWGFYCPNGWTSWKLFVGNNNDCL